MLLLIIQVYLNSFSRFASQICEIPQNCPKIQTYSSSRSSNVIVLGVNRKHMLLSISQKIVTLEVSPAVFETMTHLARK